MNREQQVYFCRKCTNRQMDFKQGVLCKLTGAKATFESECDDFKHDETVHDLPLDTAASTQEALLPNDIKQQIGTDAFEKLRLEQRLLPAIGIGLLASVVGAVLWGAFTVATKYQIGYMAVGIGAGVGYAIRLSGRGVEPLFGVCGALLALFGCLLGNFLSVVGFVANEYNLGYVQTLTQLDYGLLPSIMIETFSVIDILFYGLAIYWGYKFSFRQVTAADLARVTVNA